MSRTKADSIRAMGLEAFINKTKAYLEPQFGVKPYNKLVEAFTAGWSDSSIARLFEYTHPQSVSHLRAVYLEEQGK